jgi:hypothetical protein
VANDLLIDAKYVNHIFLNDAYIFLHKEVHLLNVKTVITQFFNRIFHFRKQKIFRNYGEEKIQMYNVFILSFRERKIKAKSLF